jgi:hypothetical protein
VARWVNEGTTDRVVRVVLGLVLGYVGWSLHGPWSIVLYVLGALSFLTGLSGVCLVYRLLGIRTCPAPTSSRSGG